VANQALQQIVNGNPAACGLQRLVNDAGRKTGNANLDAHHRALQSPRHPVRRFAVRNDRRAMCRRGLAPKLN